MYDAAAEDHEGFWAEQARTRITWAKDFERTLDWDDAPFAKWFVGGELNVAHNCVDRHVEAGNGDRVAIHFEGEAGDTRTITYADLQREVAQDGERAHRARGGAGRHRRHLHADDPRDRVHDARLRPARRPPLGDLRRLLGRGPAHPHRRRPVQGGRHHRRAVPPRQARPRSSPPSTRRCSTRTRSRRCSWCAAPRPRSTGSRAATCGGTTSSTARATPTRRSRTTASTRCSSSTPAARPGSPRASSTPAAAT